MKIKLVHMGTQFKRAGNSGAYYDYIGLQKMGFDIVEEGFEAVIFSMSKHQLAGGVVSKATEKTINTLDYARKNNIPVFCLLLDFNTLTGHNSSNSTLRKKYPELTAKEFINYMDNWYLLSYGNKLDDIYNIFENKKGLKFKKENILRWDFGALWYIDELNPIKEVENKICYIGNQRAGLRNKILSKFNGFDIIGGWTDKFKDGLNHNFLGKITENNVKSRLNKYYAQFITYDDKGINTEVDIHRLYFTIGAGCLPIIDNRCKYINLPEEFDILFVENDSDIANLLFKPIERRNNIIIKLKKYMKNTIDYKKQYDFIYNLTYNNEK